MYYEMVAAPAQVCYILSQIQMSQKYYLRLETNKQETTLYPLVFAVTHEPVI